MENFLFTNIFKYMENRKLFKFQLSVYGEYRDGNKTRQKKFPHIVKPGGWHLNFKRIGYSSCKYCSRIWNR